MCVKEKINLVLTLVYLVNIVESINPRLDPVVQINQGLVRGQQENDGKYAYFLGIPYAQVNPQNPFGPSQPHPGFGDEIFNAYDGSIECPQPKIAGFDSNKQSNQSLDCLRLNIFVPSEATSQNPFPVLVWIHGGRFEIGSGFSHDPQYFMNLGIVVVTINYRLGPYGFMCLDSPLVPGNQGLKDQYEALRWVRDNIVAFGGNPNEVTIGGQSAGSCSVLLQLYSSKDKLFKRVIAESGTPLSYGMFVEADTSAAVKLAKHLGSNAMDTESALVYLAQASTDQVISAYRELSLDLKPCKERTFRGVENFVETYPMYLSNENKIKDTPILIGHTSREEDVSRYNDDYFNSDPFYERVQTVFHLNEEQLVEASITLRHFYIGDESVSKDVAFELGDFESDFVFNHPVESIITLFLKEKANPVYKYMFSYVGNSNATMASHGAEIPYLFKNDPFGISSDEFDNKLIIERMTTLWANFIKYGNPTPVVSDLLPVEWTPITDHTRPYMDLDKKMQMKKRVYHDRMAFYDLFYDLYGRSQRMLRNHRFKNRHMRNGFARNVHHRHHLHH